jgi:divalent metal cation (Fe/Co/Zn/Cd) transporter
VYIAPDATSRLIEGGKPETSVLSMVVLAASIVTMPSLAAAKMRVARDLGGDRLIAADAAETRICLLLSISTLLGVGLYQLTGAAWLDPLAGYVIAAFAIREGLEAGRAS